MKKLLVLALSALLVLGLATVSMAAATFSGEIDVYVKGATDNAAASTSNDYAFGKMVLSGKLGDDLTGTLVFKADPTVAGTVATPSNYSLAVDEADVLFTEDWGTLKVGFFGWNSNPKDILDVETQDLKSQTNVALTFAISDGLSLGLDYAFTGSDVGIADKSIKNGFGANLGLAADVLSAEILYFNYAAEDTAWGVNAKVKLGDFTPFLEYRNETKTSNSLVNSIIGVTYQNSQPFFARAEVDLDTAGLVSNPWGIRLGYNLADGATFQVQYYNKGNSSSAYEAKLACPF